MLEPPRPSVLSIRFETGDLVRISRLSIADETAQFFFATFLRDDGKIVTHQEQLPALTAGSISQQTFVFTAGYLLTLSIVPGNTENPTGCYALIERVRGNVDIAANRLAITAGFVAEPSGLSYPQQISAPLAGNPNQNIAFTPSAPAAGNDPVIQLFNNAYWRLTSAYIRLTTSAAVGNRVVDVDFIVDSVGIGSIASVMTVAPSANGFLIFWTGPNIPANTATTFYVPIPDGLIGFNAEVDILTTNLQAADQWTFFGATGCGRPAEQIF